MSKKLLGLIRIFVSNFQKKHKLFSFWFGKRRVIHNWFACWLASTSLAVDLVFAFRQSRNLLRNFTLWVNFQSGLKLMFSADQWPDLAGYVETYDTYMAGVDIKLQDNDLVVDVGAHIGTFCIPASYNQPNLKVYAFEPDPRNFNRLLEHVRMNSIRPEEFVARQQAVYSRSGVHQFSVGPTSTTGALIEARFFKTRANAEQVVCETITLDELFEEESIEHCRLLKLDCEGSEYEIFDHLSDDVLSKIGNMIIEAHVVEGRDPLSLKAWLEKKGYKVTGVQHQNGCWDFFCNRR